MTWRAASGRPYGMDPAAVTPDGRLPAADKGDPMVGRCKLKRVSSRVESAWCQPLKLDND